MTLVSAIIKQSLRESNLIAVNAEPTTAEAAEALERLQSLVLSVLGNEVGYILDDWSVTSATAILKPSGFAQDTAGFTVNPQSRLVCNLSEPTELDLDPQPMDGQRLAVVGGFDAFNLTIDGNGRTIEGAATKLLTSAATVAQWVYRADLADWLVVDPLAADSEMPFPEEFDDYFIIMLAMRLNPRFGREMSPESMARMQQQAGQMVIRYNQNRLREATQIKAPQAGVKGV